MSDSVCPSWRFGCRMSSGCEGRGGVLFVLFVVVLWLLVFGPAFRIIFLANSLRSEGSRSFAIHLRAKRMMAMVMSVEMSFSMGCLEVEDAGFDLLHEP